jgi:hypothetical protein
MVPAHGRLVACDEWPILQPRAMVELRSASKFCVWINACMINCRLQLHSVGASGGKISHLWETFAKETEQRELKGSLEN